MIRPTSLLLLPFLAAAILCGSALAAKNATATKESAEPPASKPQARDKKPTARQHSVLKIPVEPFEPTIPRVWLSASHARQCKVGVGESFPEVKLPSLDGSIVDLASLRGTQATVVLFWHPDRWMARTALVDMQSDVASKYDPTKVSVVGIAVHQPAASAQATLSQYQVSFPQLLDAGGEALAKVGTFSLPRIYVLDPEGTILWFDIAYSEATRRELQQTLDVLTVEN